MIGKQYYSFNLLTQYFQQINKQSKIKEETMFKDTLDYWKEKFSLLWTKPVSFVDNEKQEAVEQEGQDYWCFEMRTHAWENFEGEVVPTMHDFIVDNSERSWGHTLDQILDVMGKHYGYNIKEQVYYSVKFPTNEIDKDTGFPYEGYGRSLNDDRLQLLLLAHPELYEAGEAE
jgi:hypothetical protein